MHITDLEFSSNESGNRWRLKLFGDKSDKVILMDGVYYLDGEIEHTFQPGIVTESLKVLGIPSNHKWNGVIRNKQLVLFTGLLEVRRHLNEVRSIQFPSGGAMSVPTADEWTFDIIGGIGKEFVSDPFFWDQPLGPDWVADLVKMTST
jgi:hypothetical protein